MDKLLTWLIRVYQLVTGAYVVGVSAGILCMKWVCKKSPHEIEEFHQPGSRYAYVTSAKFLRFVPVSPVIIQYVMTLEKRIFGKKK